MISRVASSDEPTIRAVLTAAGLNRGEGYTYHTLDGACLVHETEGVIDGVVRFFLGKPETWIRQLAVLPSKRGSVVAGELLEAVRQAALAYGSEGVEGFVPYDLPWVTWGYQKLGGKLCAGTRVRFLLAPAAASPSTSSSTATGPGTDAPCTLPGPSA